MFCTECGKKIDDDAAFCTYCGAPVTPLPEQPEDASLNEESQAGHEEKDATDAPSLDESQQQTTILPEQPEDASSFDSKESVHTGLPDSALLPQTPDPRIPLRDETVVMPPVQPAEQATVSAYAPPPTPSPASPSGKNPYKVIAIVAGVIAVVLIAVCGVLFGLNAGAFGGGDATESTSTEQPSSTTSTSSSSSTTPASTVQEIAVPNVVGMSQSDALAALSQKGFATSGITEEHSVSTPEGFVISQTPSGGQMGDPNTVRVSLIVSSGPQETYTETEYTVISQAMTWRDANAYCANHGGTLACITSPTEYDKVLAAAEASGLHVLWLGGQRSGSSFSWVSGEPFSYSSWAPGEPNNDGGSENYLALYNVNGTWGWYDAPNDLSTTYPAHTMGFVMERQVERTR